MILLAIMSFWTFNDAISQVHVDSVTVKFHQSKHELDFELGDNGSAFEKINNSLKSLSTDSIYRISRVSVIGAASPEGSISFNKELSRKRALTIFNHISTLTLLPDSLMSFTYLGRDWEGLQKLVTEDAEMPYKEEVDSLVRLIIQHQSENEGEVSYDWINNLKKLRGGKPYSYMYKKLFPELRATRLIVRYEKKEKETIEDTVSIAKLPDKLNTDTFVTLEEDSNLIEQPLKFPKMALKTNLLHDALLVPNIGAEFYVGSGISVSLNWQYAWWNTDNWYWRTYGGEVAVRKWLGSNEQASQLTGHHVGIFGQLLTFDFMAFGKKGYMSGDSHTDLYDRPYLVAGLEYGYSAPIAKNLNLDFVIGIGYHGGKYNEYRKVDDCYESIVRKKRHFIGPVKAEVALSWLVDMKDIKLWKGGSR